MKMPTRLRQSAFLISRIFLTGFVCVFSSVVVFGAESAKSKLDVALGNEFQAKIQPLLKKYCYECHTGQNAEAATDIAIFQSLPKIRKARSQWEQIRGLAKIGAMPPVDHDVQPSEAEREQLADWIHRALNAFDCRETNLPAPITIRRLNRMEYDFTIRDLFGVEESPSLAIGFVSDDVGNGFDNQGEVQSLSPLALEKYAQAAEWVAKKVITTDPETLREQFATALPMGVGASFRAEFLFAEGDYSIETFIRYDGRDIQDLEVEFYFADELIDTFELSSSRRSLSWKVQAKAGVHPIEFRVPKNSNNAKLEGRRDALMTISNFRVKGPKTGLPPLPLIHQRIVKATPSDSLTKEQAANQVLGELLPRAFRRPIQTEERSHYVSLVVKAMDDGWSFEESLQFVIEAILVSPEFLFRVEKPYRPPASGQPQPQAIESFDLANRLSYFLWGSMPDEPLFQLATAKKLNDKKVLSREIERMIDDPKSDALVHGFFGQWLGLRNLETVSVDERAFNLWSPKLSEALAKETFLVCREMLRDGTLGDVLRANFTFVNPRLADFYQLPFDGQDPSEMYLGSSRSSEYVRRLGNYRDEDRWLRVDLPKNRRGLLTHASVLTLTSNPTRTSPVKRGKWVLDNILGDPPPPAPPGVPSLEESVGEHAKKTLREQLAIHRENASCASCHRVLDPIGLGLENFNAIGQWRTHDEGLAVDAQGELADGRKFSGPRELLKLLESEEPKIVRHFTTQLLTYALGRGLTRGDQCAIDKIIAETKADNYSIRSLISAIINSQPFLFIGPSQATKP
jgi:hypothetical protein